MIQGKNRRLANVKTRRETGLDYVMFSLDLNTPFGKETIERSPSLLSGRGSRAA